MSWSGFGVALVVTLVLQTTFVFVLDLPVDLFLVLALVCGLVLPVPDACLAAWITGFTQDLGSAGDPLGLHAFCLGLVGYTMTRLRDVLNVHVWGTRTVALFVAALLGLWPEAAYRTGWLQSPGHTWLRVFWSPLLPAVTGAVLASLVAALPWVVVGRRRRHRFRPVRQL